MSFTTENSSKTLQNFRCDLCDYSSSRRGDFNKHLKTKRHLQQITTKMQQKKAFICNCGKSYTHRASLFNHKKKCDEEPSLQLVKREPQDTLLTTIMQQNTEFQKHILQLIDKITDGSTNVIVNNTQNIQTQNTNNTNNTLNLELQFL